MVNPSYPPYPHRSIEVLGIFSYNTSSSPLQLLRLQKFLFHSYIITCASIKKCKRHFQVLRSYFLYWGVGGSGFSNIATFSAHVCKKYIQIILYLQLLYIINLAFWTNSNIRCTGLPRIPCLGSNYMFKINFKPRCVLHLGVFQLFK